MISRRTASASLVGAGLAAIARAGGARAQALRSVEINYGASFISPSVAPLFSVPQAAGFWKDEGLDVTVRGVAGGGNALQQLVNGNVVMTFAGTPEFFSARSEGAPVVALASAYDRNTYYPVVAADSSIGSGKDLPSLKGNAIGYPSQAGGSTIYGNLILRSVGLDPDRDVRRIVTGSASAGLHELTAGRVGALQYWESAYAQMEALGGKIRRIEDIPVLAPLSFVQGFFTTKSMLQRDPKLLTGLLRGMAKGVVFANEQPELAVRMHWGVFPLTRPAGLPEAAAIEQAKFIMLDQMKTFQNMLHGKFGFATPQMVVAVRDALFDAKYIKAKLAPEEYFDDGLLAEVNGFDQAAVRAAAQTASYGRLR